MAEIFWIVVVAGVAFVAWKVWAVYKRREELQNLLSYARQERERFEDDVEGSTEWNWALHMVFDVAEKLKHEVRPDDLLLIGGVIKTIIEGSKISPAAFVGNINQLESRIKRGLVIDVEAEQKIISEFQQSFLAWQTKAKKLLEVFVPLFPKKLEGGDDSTYDGTRFTVTTSLIERSEDPHWTVARVCRHMWHLDGSGYRGEDIVDENTWKLKKGRVDELIVKFLGGTVAEWLLLDTEITTEVRIPTDVRFEHTMILAGSGHGKTQTLQHLLVHDLEEVRKGNASIVVIDSQGDLISKIAHLEMFAPNNADGIAERLMLIDPNEVENPPALNMFDINMDRINSYSAADRERIMNGTIELYNYIFGALLGAEMTQKQNVIFGFLARLMLVIPDATIVTLREVMENGEPFRAYMDKLDGTAQQFFETQFFHKSFADTKQQVLRRLWGVLGNPAFERMFANHSNKVDMFAAINSGSVVLVNTAKDFLQPQWSEIFGRFFIALVTQAAIQRAVLPEGKRLNTYLYIDEAHEYFDQNLEMLLNQARKYRVGLTMTSQNTDQMSMAIRSTMLASTSVKLVGGANAKDARLMAGEMHCDADYIQSMKKQEGQTEFACMVRNVTPSAVRMSVPFGVMEGLPAMDDAQYQELLTLNRTRVCDTDGVVEDTAERPDEYKNEFELGKQKAI